MAARWQPDLVSVVVPTHNRGQRLRRVLDGFAQQTLPADRFEVCVVDDGGADDTAEIVAAYAAAGPYRLTLLRQANQGPAAARNAGLARAPGDVVLFIDDDCVPEPALLAEHVASHDVEGLAVIGRIVWHPDLTVTPFMRYIEADMFAYANIPLAFDAGFACFYTGNASVHRASAIAVGGFDPDFPRAMHEDIDFGYRLRRHGVRLVFNPRARVQHDRPMEFLPALAMQRTKGREAIRFWAKHPELHDLVPVSLLIDPTWRNQWYRAMTTYYFMLGMQDGLDDGTHYDPREVLPEQFELVHQRWIDRRIEELHAEIDGLRAELRQVERQRQWAERLARAHAALERAYQEQADWAAELAERLERREPIGALAGLLRRLAGAAAPPAGRSGLAALLARRRAAAAPAPHPAPPTASRPHADG